MLLCRLLDPSPMLGKTTGIGECELLRLLDKRLQFVE